MSGAWVCMCTLWILKKPLIQYTEPMEHHEKLWDTTQDGECDRRHIPGLRVCSY